MNPDPGSSERRANLPEKKRRRPALACEECRRRKVRCDRAQPCANCIRAQHPSECIYQADPRPLPRRPAAAGPVSAIAPRSQTQSHSHSHVHSYTWPAHTDHTRHLVRDFERPRSELDTPFTGSGFPVPFPPNGDSNPSSESAVSPKSHFSSSSTVTLLTERIKELEERLSQVLSTNNSFTTATTTTSSHPPTNPTRGHLVKTRYFGQSHWMHGAVLFSLLADIISKEELQKTRTYEQLAKCKTLGRHIKATRRPSAVTRDNLGSQIPSKDICDRLLDAYLRTFESVYRILHVPSFRDEYRQYWEDPASTSKGFIVQLQLVMAIGACFHDEHFSLRDVAIRWISEGQHWLTALSPSHKSRLTITGLQVMCLLHIARETTAVGADLVWISTGELLRTAVYMGLHRDPDQLAKMPRLTAELRRRLWVTILEILLQASIDSGGPPGISLSDFDTRPPANLNDEDLIAKYGDGGVDGHADIEAKPADVFTQTSVQIAMYKSFPTRLAIAHYLNDFRCKNLYDATLQLDVEMTTACRTLAMILKSFRLPSHGSEEGLGGDCVSPNSPSDFQLLLTDQATRRFLLALHLPWQAASQRDRRYYFSRKISVETALNMYRGFKAPPAGPSSSPGGGDSGGPSEAANSSDGSEKNSPGGGNPGQVESVGRVDYRRLCICAAGHYRSMPYQSIAILALELLWQLEDERAAKLSAGIECDLSLPAFSRIATCRSGSSLVAAGAGADRAAGTVATDANAPQMTAGGLAVMPYPELLEALRFGAEMAAQRVLAGETNIKGHLSIHCLLTQAEALQRGCRDDEIRGEVIKAAEMSATRSYDLLKTVAARSGAGGRGEQFSRDGSSGVIPGENGIVDGYDADVAMAGSTPAEKIMAFGGPSDNAFLLPMEGGWDWDSFMNNQGLNFLCNIGGVLDPLIANTSP